MQMIINDALEGLYAEVQASAACRGLDPDVMFPVGNGKQAQIAIDRAKRVCARCPVLDQCREWALATSEEFGVWGGTDEAERLAHFKAQRRARRKVAVA